MMSSDIYNVNFDIDENIKFVNCLHIDKVTLAKEINKLLDDKVVSYLGFDGTADQVVEKILNKAKTMDSYLYYLIYCKNTFVGIFYLYDIKKKYSRANITLALVPNKRGFMLSLSRINALIKFLFEIGFNRLGMEIEDDNEASLKLAKHLDLIGFKYEGKLRDNYGIGIHSNVYSLLKSDWSETQIYKET